MNNKYEEALVILKKYGQDHLLKNYNKLNEEIQEKLLNDILTTDFEQINRLYENIGKNKKEIVASKIEPIEYVEKEKLTNEEKEYYSKIGDEHIKNGEYAVITMAGGQRNKVRTYRSKRYF